MNQAIHKSPEQVITSLKDTANHIEVLAQCQVAVQLMELMREELDLDRVERNDGIDAERYMVNFDFVIGALNEARHQFDQAMLAADNGEILLRGLCAGAIKA